VAAIANPEALLRVSWLDLGLLAATGYYVVPALRFWLQQLTFARSGSTDLATLVSWLAGGAVGFGLWTALVRDDLARSATGRRSPRRTLVVTLALTAGTAVGAWLIPLPGQGAGAAGSRPAAVWAVIGLVTLVACLVLVAVAAALARRASARLGSRRRFAWTFWTGGVAVAAVGALLSDYGQLLLVVTSLPELGAGAALAYAGMFALFAQHAGWLIVAAALAATASVLLSRSTAGGDAAWMYLPEVVAQTTPYNRSPASPSPGTM